MTNADCERFYRLRDQRSLAYGASEAALDRTVGLVADGAAAHSRGGQVALLALANMISRVHRRVAVSVPEAPLLAASVFGTHGSLSDTVVQTMLAVNPCIDLQLRAPTVDETSIGMGDVRATVRVGLNEATAYVSSEPQPVVGEGRAAALAAGIAACLGAAELYKMAHGRSLRPSSLSLADLFGSNSEADSLDLPRLDVGDVAVVGAGAVSSALAYWLHEVGHEGRWIVLDRDVVKLHNTNRSLAFSAADAGWPHGSPQRKVDIVALLLGAKPLPMWYDEWVTSEPEARPELILPLANERGVREAVNQRGLPVVVHATTSPAWQAQLHRHIAGRDGCIGCRFPPAVPRFECSGGSALEKIDETASGDAALPFLSAAAGLLLIAGLYRLALTDGPRSLSTKNLWWLAFDGEPRLFRGARAQCGPSCAAPSPALVRRINEGNRWLGLIGAM